MCVCRENLIFFFLVLPFLMKNLGFFNITCLLGLSNAR